MKKLSAMGESRAIAALEHSTASNYQGIYEPKPVRGEYLAPDPQGDAQSRQHAMDKAKRKAEEQAVIAERAAKKP